MTRSDRNLFLSAMFLSTAINFRSIFLLLMPVYLYFLLRASNQKGVPLSRALAFIAAGVAIPTIPSLVLFLQAPSQFLFSNLVFHLYRQPITPFSALILHKVKVFGTFLALPQTILLLGALLGSWYLLKHRLVELSSIYRRSLLFAALISLIYLIPTPVLLQYFQEAVPYLIIAALPVFVFIVRTPGLKPLRRSAGLLYAVGMLPFVYLFIVAPRPRDERFTLTHLRDVVGEIETRTSIQDTLLSEWAGYPALSDRPQLRGSEHVGFYFPLKIDKSCYSENHLLTNSDIVSALQQQRPKLVLVDYKVYPEWQGTLDSNYHLASTIGDTQLYERNREPL